MSADAFVVLVVLANGEQVPMTASDVANAFLVNSITGETNFVIDTTTILKDVQCSEDGEDTTKLHLYKGSRDTGIYWFHASLLVSLSKRPLIPQEIKLTPGTYYIKQEA